MRDTPDDAAWREQCRHQLELDVVTRIKYGFCHVHKPVLDDVPVSRLRDHGGVSSLV